MKKGRKEGRNEGRKEGRNIPVLMMYRCHIHICEQIWPSILPFTTFSNVDIFNLFIDNGLSMFMLLLFL